jgi:hypothetical protein
MEPREAFCFIVSDLVSELIKTAADHMEIAIPREHRRSIVGRLLSAADGRTSMMYDLIPIAVIGASMALVVSALFYVRYGGKEPDIFSVSNGDEILGHVMALDMFDAIERASERFGHEDFDKLEGVWPCCDKPEMLKDLLRTREAELAQARAEASSAETLIAHLRVEVEKMQRELYGQ